MFGTGPCKNHSDCTDGKDGLCIMRLPSATCLCTYDACFADSDCAGGVCVCSGSYSGNACVSGNCRVDADCGDRGYCSPVFAACSVGTIIGYRCHTQKDKCVTDADCDLGWNCTFRADGWACSAVPSCIDPS
jgi:hypothetical protein